MLTVVFISLSVPIDCGHPGILDHGRVLGNNTQYGDTITFSCDPGYQLSDDSQSSVRCQHDGHWNHPIPTCVQLSVQASPASTTLSPPSADNLIFLRIIIIVTIVAVVLFLLFAVSFLCIRYHKASSRITTKSEGHLGQTRRGNGMKIIPV